MREWTIKELKELQDNIKGVLCKGVGIECTNRITSIILLDVAQDISETADKEYNDSDVRLAVGRAILKKLGIEREV